METEGIRDPLRHIRKDAARCAQSAALWKGTTVGKTFQRRLQAASFANSMAAGLSRLQRLRCLISERGPHKAISWEDAFLEHT